MDNNKNYNENVLYEFLLDLGCVSGYGKSIFDVWDRFYDDCKSDGGDPLSRENLLFFYGVSVERDW